ncbi:MAG TPA: hypothetical protein VNI57_02940 [Candidatus Saccharimonadales bacterium]|nr:hypothetical protein [Candidatus Saccharimonadales bacterium]
MSENRCSPHVPARVWPTIAIAGILAAACVASTPALDARASDFHVLERGYRVKYFEACGTEGASLQYRQSDPYYIRPLIKDIKCSPGGPWGSYVYLLTTTQDPAAGIWVDVERDRFNGKSEYFRNTDVYDVGIQLSLAPVGWSGGDILFAGAGIPGGEGLIRWIQPSGAWDPRQTPADGLAHLLGPSAVDPGGDFAGSLFYVTDGVIQRVDDLGNESFFAQPPSVGSEMRFGPGGQWGTDLYTGGYVIDPNGRVAAFPAVFDEFDWAQGGGFDGDMFELHRGNPYAVDRIEWDGTRTPFATGPVNQVAFCDGSLWFTGPDGCYVVTPKGKHKSRTLVLR